MPLYDYRCPKCGELTDIWAKIDEKIKGCPQCGEDMARLLSPTRIQCDLRPYWDENLADRANPHGQYVESRQHRRQLMKEQGLAEL